MKTIATLGFCRTFRNVAAVVAEAVGNGQGVPIEDLDEARRIAFGETSIGRWQRCSRSR
jgi:hypothetical protein